MSMVKQIWLSPPLAVARVGASSTPCAAYLWGANDATPRGFASTTISPAETLTLGEDGGVRSSQPHELRFRDEEGIRPVCPFFELHGTWEEGGTTKSGPITAQLLASLGGSLDALTWEVRTCNLKAFHYTYLEGDRVEARVTLAGADTQRKVLAGVSPAPGEGGERLVPEGAALPMGAVQLARPDADHAEVRLRFYAPRGLIYGPTDLAARMAATDFDFEIAPGQRPNAEYRGFGLPAERLILNPASSWARYIPELATLGPLGGGDYRNTPGGLLATLFEKIPWLDGQPVMERSLGLLDDVSDGLVSCTLRLGGATLTAVARVVVGPPDFAPANRPPVSLADALADREDRASPREGWTKEELNEVVIDILERAFEASSLMHKDYQNFRSHRTNSSTLVELGPMSPFDDEDVRAMLWPAADLNTVVEGRSSAMALSEVGVRRHRRNLAAEFLEDRFREAPQLFEQWIRRPVDRNPFFDRRMPALMRGSDGRPLHLTRRQWEIFRAWIDALEADTSAAGPSPRGPRP
jgi:hypothetical protein